MIMLGPGCVEVAKTALVDYPGVLQVGGGINDRNAAEWIECGASKVSPSVSAFECQLLCRTFTIPAVYQLPFDSKLDTACWFTHSFNELVEPGHVARNGHH